MVLQLLATGLKDFLYNQEAVIIRYGGDEFIICLRHKSKMFLNDSIKELHAYMLTLKLEHEYDSYPLKVSLGACLNDQKNYEYIKLFKQADRNLYKAKNNGRASYVISVQ